MANIIKDLIERIKIDWQEWKMYQRSAWDVRRERKAIARAIARAREKNFSDGRTYYIIKDRFGGINELNSDQLRWFTSRGVFTSEQYKNRFKHAIDIVTSNKHVRDQYYKVHHNTKDNE